METALLSYGGCRGLVGGFYGEMSPNFDRLVKAAAAKGAELHAGKYGLTDGDKIRSVLANKIRTNWAMALAHKNAHIKLANIRWVRGAGFEEARYDTEADMHSRWNKQREEYRYANDEYRGACACLSSVSWPRARTGSALPCCVRVLRAHSKRRVDALEDAFDLIGFPSVHHNPNGPSALSLIHI